MHATVSEDRSSPSGQSDQASSSRTTCHNDHIIAPHLMNGLQSKHYMSDKVFIFYLKFCDSDNVLESGIFFSEQDRCVLV